MVKQKANIAALKYLKRHIKSKGKEIEYTELKMKKYLTSQDEHMSIEEKRYTFKIRSRMTEIKTNMKRKYSDVSCEVCKMHGKSEEESDKHIYTCKFLMESEKMNNEIIPDFESVFTENTVEIASIVRLYMENINRRRVLLEKEIEKLK